MNLQEGNTCLHLASFAGHLEVVKFLLDHLDSDVQSLRNHAGKTALDFAKEKEHAGVIEALEGAMAKVQ